MMSMEFRDKHGNVLATDYIRLVVGGRGRYIEFDKDQINWDVFSIPEEQKYRTSDKWRQIVYYIEYRSKWTYVMLYEQLKTVNYADYKIGRYYIAIGDVVWDGTELRTNEEPAFTNPCLTIDSELLSNSTDTDSNRAKSNP